MYTVARAGYGAPAINIAVGVVDRHVLQKSIQFIAFVAPILNRYVPPFLFFFLLFLTFNSSYRTHRDASTSKSGDFL